MANPVGYTTSSPEINAARTAVAKAWTDPANWDGDDYIGPGLPPWGNRTRCSAVRGGRRCRKGTIPGGTVCNTHGGAAPQVRRRAKLRALQLLDPALGQLARIIANPSDQRTALAAIKLVAELNGMGRAANSEVSGDVAKALLMERYYALREAREKAEAAALEDGETLEAEVLDEDALEAAVQAEIARREAEGLRADPSGLLGPERPPKPPAPEVVLEYPETPHTIVTEYKDEVA